MFNPYENGPLVDARELKNRISKLENQYAEFFLAGSDKDLLKRIHLNLKMLKVELQRKESKFQ